MILLYPFCALKKSNRRCAAAEVVSASFMLELLYEIGSYRLPNDQTSLNHDILGNIFLAWKNCPGITSQGFPALYLLGRKALDTIYSSVIRPRAR